MDAKVTRTPTRERERIIGVSTKRNFEAYAGEKNKSIRFQSILYATFNKTVEFFCGQFCVFGKSRHFHAFPSTSVRFKKNGTPVGERDTKTESEKKMCTTKIPKINVECWRTKQTVNPNNLYPR